MSISDLRQFTGDVGQVGENLARTFRVIAKVLLDWASRGIAEEDFVEGGAFQKGSGAKHPCLNAIEFDKLTTLFCRIWNELHREGKVRYRAALVQRRGFHGPGMAIKINREEDEIQSLGKDPNDKRHSDWAYITEIVEKLKPALADTRAFFRLEGNAWDPKCKVYPGLEPSVWDSWLAAAESEDPDRRFLTLSEVAYFQAVTGVISQLDKKEIRALGTHCNAADTWKDIFFNFNAWSKNFRKIIGFLHQQNVSCSQINDSAHIMVTTAREILWKSKNNRKVYKAGREKCKKALHGNEILNIFIKIQHSDDSIWDDDLISVAKNNAQLLIDFAVYCRRGIIWQSQGSKLTAKENDEANRAYTKLREFASRTDLDLPSYEQIVSIPGFQWADALEKIMDEVLICLPFDNRVRQLGVP